MDRSASDHDDAISVDAKSAIGFCRGTALCKGLAGALAGPRKRLSLTRRWLRRAAIWGGRGPRPGSRFRKRICRMFST
jgi:hypothetical protein